MKYLVLSQLDPEDWEKMLERMAKVRERREKTGEPRKGWKQIFPAHAMRFGPYTGVLICETDEEGLLQYGLDYPEAKPTFIPLIHVDEWVKAYEKSK